MPYRDLEPISKQLTIVVGFMAFGLALSYYRNILFDEHLTEIARQNDELALQIQEERGDLDYFQSAQYKDKYAKETLGRLNPGEKALIITQQPKAPDLSTSLEFTPTEQQQAAYRSEEHTSELQSQFHL